MTVLELVLVSIVLWPMTICPPPFYKNEILYSYTLSEHLTVAFLISFSFV